MVINIHSQSVRGFSSTEVITLKLIMTNYWSPEGLLTYFSPMSPLCTQFKAIWLTNMPTMFSSCSNLLHRNFVQDIFDTSYENFFGGAASGSHVYL